MPSVDSTITECRVGEHEIAISDRKSAWIPAFPKRAVDAPASEADEVSDDKTSVEPKHSRDDPLSAIDEALDAAAMVCGDKTVPILQPSSIRARVEWTYTHPDAVLTFRRGVASILRQLALHRCHVSDAAALPDAQPDRPDSQCVARWADESTLSIALADNKYSIPKVTLTSNNATTGQSSPGSASRFEIVLKECSVGLAGPIRGLVPGARRQNLRLMSECRNGPLQSLAAQSAPVTLTPTAASGAQIAGQLGVAHDDRAIRLTVTNVPTELAPEYLLKSATGLQLARFSVPSLSPITLESMHVRYSDEAMQRIAGGPATEANPDSTNPGAGSLAAVIDPTNFNEATANRGMPAYGVINEASLNLPVPEATTLKGVHQLVWCARPLVPGVELLEGAGSSSASTETTTGSPWIVIADSSVQARVRRELASSLDIELRLSPLKDPSTPSNPSGNSASKSANASQTGAHSGDSQTAPRADDSNSTNKQGNSENGSDLIGDTSVGQQYLVCLGKRDHGDLRPPCDDANFYRTQKEFERARQRNLDGNAHQTRLAASPSPQCDESLLDYPLTLASTARRESIPIRLFGRLKLACAGEVATDGVTIAPNDVSECRLEYSPYSVRGDVNRNEEVRRPESASDSDDAVVVSGVQNAEAERIARANLALHGLQALTIEIRADDQEEPRRVVWKFDAEEPAHSFKLNFPTKGQTTDDYAVSASITARLPDVVVYRRGTTDRVDRDATARRFEFSAQVRPRGPFGWCWSDAVCIPIRSFLTVPIVPFAARFPASALDLTHSSDATSAQLTALRTGLFLAVEPWDYRLRRNPFPLPIRFTPIGFLLNGQSGASVFPPSIVFGVSLAQPLVTGNPQLGASATASILFEHDMRTRGGNHLLLLLSLDILSLLSPQQAPL